MKIFAGILFAAMLASCSLNSQPAQAVSQNVQSTDAELGAHVLKTMSYVKSPLSPIRRQMLAQVLVNVANNTFENLADKKDWIRILAIESRFDNSARSPVNATGLGQVMPQHAKEFGKLCGMTNLQEGDVADLMINATLSACVWRHLLETVPERSVILALSSYNAGPSSSSTKNIQGMRTPVEETAGYITKFSYLKEVTEKPSKK